MLDSWLSVGGATSATGAAGWFGLLKSDDNGVATVVNAETPKVVQNTDASAGIPVKTQDGLISTTSANPVQATTFVGFTTETDVFLDGTLNGPLFSTTNASWASLSGSVGPDANNRVLIAQITTDGVFHYELNIQIGTPSGGTQQYVALNPVGSEISIPSMMGTLGAANVLPTISITTPSTGASFITGDPVSIAATAADADGTVASVEFFVDAVSVGVDATAPFTAIYTSAVGSHSLTAKATDNQGGQTTSAAVAINVVNNVAPTVSVTAPSNAVTTDVVPISATAADADGSVVSVEFFVDGVSFGVDATAPYTANYTAAAGTHSITAVATDNRGLTGTSAPASIIVANNIAPAVSVTAPAAPIIAGDIVVIHATAADIDGTVASVEFFVDAISIGVDVSAPFAANYTATSGSHSLTARATDNRGLTGNSLPVSINVLNNTPPTVSVTAPAAGSSFTAPAVVSISANAADVDGTVASVEFFVNGVSVNTDMTSPFQFNWTSVIGAANLTAKATDNKGATTLSAIVAITIEDPNALPYRVGTIYHTCQPTTFCLPVVAIDSVKNVIGYDMVLHYDKTKVAPVITGTGSSAAVTITQSSALINSGFVDVINSFDTANGLINISAFLNASAPASATFHGVGSLFCVEFSTVNVGHNDTARFTITDLNESRSAGVVNKLVEPGKYITYKDSTFHGALKFWTDNSPINYDVTDPNHYLVTNVFGTDVNCSNKSAVSVQPNVFGNFTYSILNGTSIQIQRDILNTTNPQSVILVGGDGYITKNLLLNNYHPGASAPTIYQMIAMDVNMDGVISAGDMSQISLRSVKTIGEFKQQWNASNGQASKDWLFVDSSRIASNPAYHMSATFPLNDGIGYSKFRVPVVPFCLPVPGSDFGNCPLITSETYKGIMLGDVDGSYETIAHDGLLRKTDDLNNAVVFDLSKAVISNGYVDVPVSVKSDVVIHGLDFALQFNESSLQYNSIIDHTTYLDKVSNYAADDKTLRFGSNSIEKYATNSALVSVRFTTTSGTINTTDLSSLKGYLNGYPTTVIVKERTGILDNSEQVVSIYPNPASNLLNVEVSENSTVQLFDLSGRQVSIETNVNANQKQEISTQHLVNGVYTMRISNDKFISIKKVVINK